MKTQKSDFLSTTAGVLTAAVAANLLWGSASPCIKLGYQFFQVGSTEVMSQILFAGVRFFLAGVLTILMGSLLRGRVLRPERGSGGMILALAMMQTVIQYSFFYIGLSKAPGFKGSITSPTSTFFAILIASLILRQEKLTGKKILGSLIGFAGVVVVNLGGGSAGGFRLTGEGFLILAAFSYGCSSVGAQRLSVRAGRRADDPGGAPLWRTSESRPARGLAADAVSGLPLRRGLYPLVAAAAAASGLPHHGLRLFESRLRRGALGHPAGGGEDPQRPALSAGHGAGVPGRLDREQAGETKSLIADRSC